VVSHRFSEERRQHPRVTNNVPLKLCSDEGDFVTESWNLSRSGIYCRVNQFIEPMTKLKINLLLPLKKSEDKIDTKKIACQGVVVRTEPIEGSKDYNVAIFFNELHQKDADYISDYVTEQLEKD
jgi:hypothetical protein